MTLARLLHSYGAQERVARLRRLSLGRLAVDLLKHLALFCLAFTFVLPFYWMFSSALKDDPQVYTVPPLWVPTVAHWDNFWKAWHVLDFSRFTVNTVVWYAIPATIGTVISSVLVAYGFARLRWPGRDLLFVLCIATMILPFQVRMVPLFILFKQLGWINSYAPLVVPNFLGVPFFIFLLRQFFLTIPKDLSDAARIDGASEIGILVRVILPLSRPALAVVVLFRFIWAWNDYLGPLIYLNRKELYTLAQGVDSLRLTMTTAGVSPMIYPYLMAVSAVITLPILVVFFLVQRTFIEGISVTGIKG